MRRILAVTSGRADATPMAPVIDEVRRKCEVIHLNLEGLSPWEAARGAEVVAKHYDVVLLLGDRYEILAAALAATVAKVPIAHIHGGEASFGSFDNQIRDAITKLAHIHFVAAHEFKLRLVEGLGEGADRVHVVGAPGLDNLVNLPPRKPEKYFVCTYHPATLSDDTGLPALLEALKQFPGYNAIWTGANNDPGSDRIRSALSGHDVRSLGPREYVALCRNAAAVVGNSSSGIIEAPTLEVPTVNVGPRQDGRLRGPSIFDAEEPDGIASAIASAVSYRGPYTNPYGGSGASRKIAEILATAKIDMVKRW